MTPFLMINTDRKNFKKIYSARRREREKKEIKKKEVEKKEVDSKEKGNRERREIHNKKKEKL